jgi:hypothetical protein
MLHALVSSKLALQTAATVLVSLEQKTLPKVLV